MSQNRTEGIFNVPSNTKCVLRKTTLKPTEKVQFAVQLLINVWQFLKNYSKINLSDTAIKLKLIKRGITSVLMDLNLEYPDVLFTSSASVLIRTHTNIKLIPIYIMFGNKITNVRSFYSFYGTSVSFYDLPKSGELRRAFQKRLCPNLLLKRR